MVADTSGDAQRTLVIRRQAQELPFTVPAGRLGVLLGLVRADG
jgi:hypothetical protein